MTDVLESNPQAPEAAEKMPLQGLIEQYTRTYEELSSHERTREELARMADELDQNREEKLTEEQKNDQAFLRTFVVLESPEMVTLRAQLMDSIFRELESATPEKQENILNNLFDDLKKSEIVDIYFIDELLQKRHADVIAKTIASLQSAAVIQKCNEAISRNEIIEEQRTIFGFYAFELLVKQNNHGLIKQLTKPENKNLEAFSNLTFAPYNAYLATKNLPLAQYCPNQAWYKQLCENTGIIDRLNLMNISDYREVSAFSGKMTADAKEMEKQAKTYPEDSPERIRLTNEAKALRELQEMVSDSVVNIPAGASIQMVNDIGGVFGFLSRGMDKVGSYISTPGRFRDLKVDQLGWKAIQGALAATVALNFASLGVAEYNHVTTFLRQFFIERKPSLAMSTIPKMFSSLWNALPGQGLTILAAGAVMSDWGGFGRAKEWVETNGRKYLEKGGELALTQYISFSSEDYFNDLSTTSQDKWKAIKKWPGLTEEQTAEIIEKYKIHFETMKTLQDQAIKALGITPSETTPIYNVSIGNFNEFLAGFGQDNDLQNPTLKPITLVQMKSIGLVTETEAKGAGADNFTPDAELAKKLIEQSLWINSLT